MSVVEKFVLTVGLIVLATAAGYLSRRAGLVPERAAKWLMTAVVAFGYSAVGFLAIWGMRLNIEDAWLPVLGAAHVVLMGLLGLAAARWLVRSPEGPGRRRRGLFTIASAMGNTGFTMGGFVVYILFGEPGLALVSILGLMWMPTLVLVVYPTARHFAAEGPAGSPLRLVLRSLLDYRSIGLPAACAAIALSLAGVPRPDAVAAWGVVNVLIFLVTAAAYFAIGLRLHLSGLRASAKLIAALAGVRFLAAPAVGAALVALTCLTAWPLEGVGRSVLLIETSVPMAVTVVAVANMFGLRPREASVLFVANSLIYLLCVLPVVLWAFGT